jgi:translation initiation factor 4G
MSWCHRSLFHVADEDGEAVAALCAFEPGALGDTSLAAPLYETFALLGWTEERIAAVGPRFAPYLRCFPEMPAGTWIVENVGTREDARRRGLVRALLDVALAEGEKSGCKAAQISCLIGNDPAQRAYERAGFEVVEERRDAEFEAVFGAPGFSRMMRPLGESR